MKYAHVERCFDFKQEIDVILVYEYACTGLVINKSVWESRLTFDDQGLDQSPKVQQGMQQCNEENFVPSMFLRNL